MLHLDPSEPTPPGDILEIDYRGNRYRFVLPDEPDHVVDTIASMRTFYEIEMLEDICGRVRPKDLVLDIGAHVGNHTIYLAGVCGCEVLAFEPFPDNFAILNANIALNGLGAQVRSFPIALGASVGRGVARLKDAQNRGSVVIDQIPGASGIPINPLDAVELPRDPAVLKIDVEGAEFAVLEGAQSLLRRCRPLLYLETIDADAFETAVRFLDGFGYQVVACFNATPTFLFSGSDNPRISAAERRLDRAFGRSCIRHRVDQHELRVKVREAQHHLSETEARFESSRTQLAESTKKLKKRTENLKQRIEKLKQTIEMLRRERRWLMKVRNVAGRRKRGPVYRIRRALATATLLPRLMRRFLVRRLVSRQLRRTADLQVRQPLDTRSASHRAVPLSAAQKRSVAIDVTPAASTAEQTQPPAKKGRADLEFRDFFGLRLAFAERVIKHADLVDQKPYLFLGNPAKFDRSADPKGSLIERCGVTSLSGYTVGITSANGAWFRCAALLKSLGAGSVVILLQPKSNELLVPKRVGIQIDTIGTIFIPNYKCGYASFRKFCFDHFDEFAKTDKSRSDSLNDVIDFSSDNVNHFVIFSMIRHPLRRFRSLYFDKFSRSSTHSNFESFEQPFRLFLNKTELTPADVLELISQIPDEYSDPHWKSQHFNTTFNGRKLVDFYVRMEHISDDLSEVSRAVGFDINLPRTLRTEQIARDHPFRTHFEREEILDKLRRRYPDDFLRLGYS